MIPSMAILRSCRWTLLSSRGARKASSCRSVVASAASRNPSEAMREHAEALRARAASVAPTSCWSQPPDSPPAFLSPPPSSATLPLSGLSFASKEMYDVVGTERAFGSPSYREWKKKIGKGDVVETAPAVAALVAAGATLVGRTTMSELAYDLAGDHEFYEAPPNPAFLSSDARGGEGEEGGRTKETPPSPPVRLCGGSSSGSACAVASGAVDFALGSDTGGSVRVPASYCGVFGFRPTHGRVVLERSQAFAPSFDTGGWFAGDAGTLLRVGGVLLETGEVKREEKASKLERWLVAADAFDRARPDVARAIFDAVSKHKTGIEKLLSPPTEVRIWDESGGLGSSEAKDAFRFAQAREIVSEDGLGEFLSFDPKLGEVARGRIEFAKSVTREQELRALDVRARYTAWLDGLLGDDGAIFLPAAPDTAPVRGVAATDAARNAVLELTSPAGLAGLPQVVVPVGRGEDGGPVGLGIIGPRGSDERLLELAVGLAEVLGL